MPYKQKAFFVTLFLILGGSNFCNFLYADEIKLPDFFYEIQKFIKEFKFADDGGVDLLGVHFFAGDGIEMTYMIEMKNSTQHDNIQPEGADTGRITMSLYQSRNADWYMIDCTMGFYYDLTKRFHTGIETAWNVIDNDLRFFVRPAAKFKAGEYILLKGYYELGNLNAKISQSVNIQLTFSRNF